MSDARIPVARVSASLSSDSQRGRGAKMSFSSKRSAMTVIEVTSQSKRGKERNENWMVHAQTGTATSTTLHRSDTEDMGERKVTASFGGAVSWAPCGGHGIRR